MLQTHSFMLDGTLGVIRASEHAIDTSPDALHIWAQPYRTRPLKRQVISDQMNKMLKLNVIATSYSAWASFVVIVPKKNGKARFSVDYRRLNNITKKDAYLLPRMEDCLVSLGDAQVFTSLDCTAAYRQVLLRKDDQEKTAFTAHGGTYPWLSMPFGLTNAHATFQRALDNILSGLKWQVCLVYLDDVIIFSSVAEQHVKDVDTVLSRGSVHGLSGSSHSFSHVESESAEPLWCQQGAFFSKLQEEIAAGWLSVRGRRGGPTLGLPKRAFLAHLLRGLSSATMRWVLSTRRACADGSIVHGLEGKRDSPGLHAPTQPDSSEETVAATISTYIWGSKHSALPQLQQSSKSASTTPQRPIWNSFAIPGTCGHDPGLQGGRALAHGSTSGT